jgi:hypothetical protein
MGTYNVVVTKCESAALTVEAENASVAELLALQEAESFLWEPDTINTQVDDVHEMTTR